MTDPARAERLWLALAVATFWVLSVGAATEQDSDHPLIADLAPTPSRPRRIRLFRLGRLTILAVLAGAHVLPLPGPLTADHWPGAPAAPSLASPAHPTTARAP